MIVHGINKGRTCRMVILPIIILSFFTSVSAQPLSQEDNGRQAFAGIDDVSAGFRQVTHMQ